MKRLTVAILFGGCSEEHDVSVKSAMEIASSIDPQKYGPVYIGITKAGPVGLEAARSRRLSPRTISALVPTSTTSVIRSA